MKKIPTFHIFNNQQLGLNKQQLGHYWDSIEECLQYAALYMHTWNLLEWIMANIIAADNGGKDNELVKEIWATEEFGDKCKQIKKIYEPQNENPNRDDIVTLVDNIKNDSCIDLRDTIAHSHVYWVVAIGAYQEQTGWVRLKRIKKNNKKAKLYLKKNEEATGEWKSALSNSGNPEITEDDINLPIYTTYGKSEIIFELKKLMDYIRLFDYDPLSDRVVNHYRQTLERTP